MAMVCIWYPQAKEGVVNPSVDVKSQSFDLGFDQDRLYVGHSSLLLDKLRRPVYVSWWPGREPTYREDVKLEGNRNPTSLISLETLDESKVADWWAKKKSRRIGARGGYDLFNMNCSTVVAQALLMGGAAAIVPAPTYDSWTPLNLETWARSLVAKSSKAKEGVYQNPSVPNLLTRMLGGTAYDVGEYLMTK